MQVNPAGDGYHELRRGAPGYVRCDSARSHFNLVETRARIAVQGNHPCTSIATLSATHLAAAWPGTLREWPFTVGLGAVAADVVAAPVRLEGSEVRGLDAPGLYA